MARSSTALLGLLGAVALLPAAGPLPAQEAVTIYRCVDAAGRVSIGNVPCPAGQRQETRSMARPVDADPPPAAAAEPTPTPAPVAEVRYVVVTPPPALYECVRPDGGSYLSDTPDGGSRLLQVLDWTRAWPVQGRHRPRDAGARGPTTPTSGGGLSAPPASRISIPSDPPRPRAGGGPGPRPPIRGPVFGTTVVERDRCTLLPPGDACARLRGQRDDVRRRFFGAAPLERDTLRLEERGLNARIDRHCRTW